MGPDPFATDGPRLLEEADRAHLQAWVRSQADAIGLRDWRVTVSPYPAHDGHFATSHLRVDAEDSTIAVSADFLTMSDQDQRRLLAHELLHCHVQPIVGMAMALVDGELGTRAEALISTAVGRVEERSIDRLATALAELLPPIGLGPAKGSEWREPGYICLEDPLNRFIATCGHAQCAQARTQAG